jgi:Ca-activated chloride channel family protein
MFDLQFQYGQALWLLTAVPFFIFLYVLYLLWRRRAAKRVGDPRLLKTLTKRHSPLKAGIQFTLLLLAFALGCIALANPRKAAPGGDEVRKGIDIVIALDISNSMLAADVAGGNRLTRAKEFVQEMVRVMPENRFALVVFAGQSYVQMPLTFDHSATRLFLASATPDAIAAQGTGINEALKKSEPVFSATVERYKSVILITDGETHDEGAVEAATALAARGVQVHTVGIGTAGGAAVIDAATGEPRTDASGNVIISRLNEPLLQQVAAAAKGSYINLQSPAAAVTQLQSEFATVEKKALVDVSLLNYETFYSWLAAPMLLLLLVGTFFGDRKNGVS